MTRKSNIFVGIVLLVGAAIIAGALLLGARSRHAGTIHAGRAIAVPQRPSRAPVDAPKPSPDLDADRAIEKAIRDLPPERSLSPKIAGWAITLKTELDKRQRVVSALAPYSERADALKAAIVAEEGPVTRDKVPAILARAQRCEAQFWKEGDFDNADSSNAIYQARAALDLCLGADPDDERALREMLEVLQAGWPSIMDPIGATALFSSSDPAKKALLERNFECIRCAGPVAWTLWSKCISKHAVVTIDDLSVAVDALLMTPGDDVLPVADIGATGEKHNASKQEIQESRGREVQRLRGEALDWALAACRRNPDWQAYCPFFEDAKARLSHTGFAPVGISIRVMQGGDPHSARYWGRFDSFLGPEERRTKLILTAPLLPKTPAPGRNTAEP